MSLKPFLIHIPRDEAACMIFHHCRTRLPAEYLKVGSKLHVQISDDGLDVTFGKKPDGPNWLARWMGYGS